MYVFVLILSFFSSRGGWNVVTPVTSPLEHKNDSFSNESSPKNNFFFANDPFSPHSFWRRHWKRKT